MTYTVSHPLLRRWQDEHAEAMRRLEDMRRALELADWRGLREGAQWLHHELKDHNESEEVHLFPLLERHLPPGFGPTQTMRMEHRQIWAATESLLAGLLPDEPESPDSVGADARTVIDALSAHIRKEDGILYPMVERLLAEAELAELAGVA